MQKISKNPLVKPPEKKWAQFKGTGATVAALCIVCTLFFATQSCGRQEAQSAEEAETPYYYYGNVAGGTTPGEMIYKKQFLRLNTKYAALSLKEPQLPEDILQRGITAGEFFNDYGDNHFQYKGKPGIRRYWTELSINKNLTENQYLELLANIKLKNKDVFIGPYFNNINGDKFAGEGFVIIVALKKADDEELLVRMAEQNGCIIVDQNRWSHMSLWFRLSITEHTELHAREIANIFFESGLFECVNWGSMNYGNSCLY